MSHRQAGGDLYLADTLRLDTGTWTYTGGPHPERGSSLVIFDSTVTISGDHTLFDVASGGGTKTIAAGTRWRWPAR